MIEENIFEEQTIVREQNLRNNTYEEQKKEDEHFEEQMLGQNEME